MSISDWLMISSVILAPLVAVQVSQWIELTREKKSRKLQIFSTLMATRSDRLSLEHVYALNLINIEFYNHKKIIRAWDAYRTHLHDTYTDYELWMDKGIDLLVDLLYEISLSLKYDFDKTLIKSGAYVPLAHLQSNDDIVQIRSALVEILEGKRNIPVNFTSSS